MDAWIRHYQPNSNSLNSTISYYTKGAVIGFVLDAYLRKTSKGRHNLDEVMQEMYKRYAREPYSSEAFENVVEKVGGVEAGLMLRSLLTTTADLDVDAALDWYGLELNRGMLVTAVRPHVEPLLSDFGVLWEEDEPGLVVSAVLDGSGGAVAGLMAGDDVLAIGDERLSKDNLEGLMSSFVPGEETVLLISRRGKIISLQIKLDTAIPDHYEILLKSDFNKRDISRLQKLLGQDPRKQS